MAFHSAPALKRAVAVVNGILRRLLTRLKRWILQASAAKSNKQKSNKQIHIRFAGKLKKRSGATKFNFINKIRLFKIK